jgi:hypothetical protein
MNTCIADSTIVEGSTNCESNVDKGITYMVYLIIIIIIIITTEGSTAHFRVLVTFSHS